MHSVNLLIGNSDNPTLVTNKHDIGYVMKYAISIVSYIYPYYTDKTIVNVYGSLNIVSNRYAQGK